MYKFKPFPILFYLEQLAAVVFGKQECRGMYIYSRPTKGFLGKVYMCLCMCVFKFFYETTGPIKPKCMWNQNRIGEKS